MNVRKRRLVSRVQHTKGMFESPFCSLVQCPRNPADCLPTIPHPAGMRKIRTLAGLRSVLCTTCASRTQTAKPEVEATKCQQHISRQNAETQFQRRAHKKSKAFRQQIRDPRRHRSTNLLHFLELFDGVPSNIPDGDLHVRCKKDQVEYSSF